MLLYIYVTYLLPSVHCTILCCIYLCVSELYAVLHVVFLVYMYCTLGEAEGKSPLRWAIKLI